MSCAQDIQSSLPCKCIVFEGDFYTYLWFCWQRYQIDIKYQMCICSSHRKYLSPFFCCIAPYDVESCIFSIQIFFSLHFSFFKKGLHRECKGISEINIIFFTNLELWIKRGFYQTPSHDRKVPMNQGLSVHASFFPSVLSYGSFLGIGSLVFFLNSVWCQGPMCYCV